MKYLHDGYILFCQEATHEENGRVDAIGLFDLFVVKELPTPMGCSCVLGFGTPFERRQYKGNVTIEDPDGKVIFEREFNANDPADIFKGHYIFKPDATLTKEGAYAAKVSLKNWKDDTMWDFERKFFTMLEGTPTDP
ncbi:MAG: hypothetical protein IPP57_16875 [Candidatus Obscuribacter sp.]|nr:hypothetical protein [Candidatus Obscuribacter sp.]MDQ5967816.1 hypothetical protein [Cyanobacteriota bacterium erpe_2018_sw_39hr_WHONDRS-SW48-000098_B_bin.30]MBK9622518.1 hypothetical protein [Candidatus Obscuribacter sp.]MBK9772464.1 hypothetical protein [Candidatus Obscuribacter sp.]MBL0187565.1 hypothetical protein [Candidatus Obscuribacter sp.]